MQSLMKFSVRLGLVEIINVETIYDENDNETPIEDNGMVANALKELVNLDDSDLDYAIEDDQSGWNDLWK